MTVEEALKLRPGDFLHFGSPQVYEVKTVGQQGKGVLIIATTSSGAEVPITEGDLASARQSGSRVIEELPKPVTTVRPSKTATKAEE